MIHLEGMFWISILTSFVLAGSSVFRKIEMKEQLIKKEFHYETRAKGKSYSSQ